MQRGGFVWFDCRDGIQEAIAEEVVCFARGSGLVSRHVGAVAMLVSLQSSERISRNILILTVVVLSVSNGRTELCVHTSHNDSIFWPCG